MRRFWLGWSKLAVGVDAACQQVVQQALPDGLELGDERLACVDDGVEGVEDLRDLALDLTALGEADGEVIQFAALYMLHGAAVRSLVHLGNGGSKHVKQKSLLYVFSRHNLEEMLVQPRGATFPLHDGKRAAPREDQVAATDKKRFRQLPLVSVDDVLSTRDLGNTYYRKSVFRPVLLLNA